MRIDAKRYPIASIKKLLKKKGEKIGITEVKAGEGHLIVQESDVVRVKVKEKNGQIYLNPYFPAIGNTVQMISSMLLLFIFYALGFRGSVLFAIVGGQLFSLAYYFPKANTLTLGIVKLIKQEG